MPELSIEVHHLTKRYGEFVAVDDLSFETYAGEIFGLLGPNGAGKTTTIRMLMDIFKPDAGDVRVLGQTPGRATDRIGYLPEERGLYQDEKVRNVLIYLGRLKGLTRQQAAARAEQGLARVELLDRADEKVNSLSRGMQQKLQVIASMLHEPDLLILDEPFQGLDPINVELIKALMIEQQERGATVVLSAHQMNLVEALCDRILLINRGRGVLYGPLDEIKAEYAPDVVRLRTPIALDGDIPGVENVERHEDTYMLTLHDADPQTVLRVLVDRGIPIRAFEVATAPLNEIFVSVVRDGAQTEDSAAEEEGHA